MVSLPGSFYRLLLGNLLDVPPAVRERLLATVPTTSLSLAVYSITILGICGAAVYITHAPWAWAWLAFSVLVVGWRALHPLLRRRRGRRRPLVSIMFSAGLGMASFGYGCAMSVLSGDVALTTMTFCGAMGVVAGLASRWAAVPRAAIATMVLAMAPPIAIMALQGGSYAIAAVAIAFVVASIASFTHHNQQNMLLAAMAEDQHRRMAQTDHLTGLANRVQLTEQMSDACTGLPTGGVRGRGFAVLYIDLDGFKAINDNYGHPAGDEVLQRVADCLRQSVGPDEVIARIGGDEFVVMLSDADALTARAVADEIIASISREHRIGDGRTLRVGCSVGICLAPDQGREPETLLARADAALYDVKNQGKGHTGMWRALS